LTLLTAPPAKVFDVGEPDVLTSWTPPLVDAALTEHERGDFAYSALLADAVRRDDRIFTSLDSRVLGVLGLPFAIDESDEATTQVAKKASRKLARQVKAWWTRCVPEAVLADLLLSAILCGFAVGELTWARSDRDGLLYPHLHVHSNQHVRWNPTTRALELLTQGGSTAITRGDGRFAPSASARPWMSGAIRAIGIPFLVRQFARRDWVDRSEIEATGIRKASAKEGVKKEELDAFVASIRRMGRKSVIALQNGYDFSIELTDGNAAITFEKLINHADTAITLAILGQNLTTQIEGGSFAAAGVHARVFQDRIESDVAMLSTVVREQIVRPWCLYNIPDFDEALLPWPSWDATPPGDKGKDAQALLTLSQALAGLKATGVDITPILERFELEVDDTKAPDAARDPVPADPKEEAKVSWPGVRHGSHRAPKGGTRRRR
jgi:phage gp29-like protein